MKLSLLVLATAAAALSTAYAEEVQATVKPSDGTTPAPETTAPVPTSKATEKPVTTTSTPEATTLAPSSSSPTKDTATTPPSSTTKKPSSGTASTAGPSPLDGLKATTHGSEYHMPYVRVVQARAQSDKPELIEGRFVSKFGNGDLKKGYQAAMDTANTASVEGALMFVQAEGINVVGRSAEKRCERKNGMAYIVLYEILIAQTNETIAQFSEDWDTQLPEYGPMVPMDEGRCTPLEGETVFPKQCFMFNGEDGYPDIGPFVGGGLKNDDVRAPYPNTFWFSFPHTCPLKKRAEKADANNVCRSKSRKGLCDIDKAPDGVECTYAYDILGWVAIDDVVGITSLKDESGKLYGDFPTWCKASKDHIEFSGSVTTGVMDKGLDFWKDPLNKTANHERANKVIEIYQDMLSKTFESTMVSATDLAKFKPLPDPVELAKVNPPCYKTVPKCNSGFGCKRSSFAQVCMECEVASPECKTNASFTFPELKKAPTTQKDLVSDLGGKNGATGSISKKSNSTTPAVGPSSMASASAVSACTALAVAAAVVGIAF